MKNEADYSQYDCPYSHIEKECGHELHGPEGYENTHGVWCACGFRGPVFCLDPADLNLKMMKTDLPSLVNRQAAEIERLNRVIEQLQSQGCGCDQCTAAKKTG